MPAKGTRREHTRPHPRQEGAAVFVSMKITVNGREIEVADGLSIEALLTQLAVKREFTAVGGNRGGTPKASCASGGLGGGGRRERGRPGGGGARGEGYRPAQRGERRNDRRKVKMHDTNLVLGGKDFTSRLIVGTGKYTSNEIMRQAHEESGAEIVTVAVRRVSLPGKGESILDFIDTKRFT